MMNRLLRFLFPPKCVCCDTVVESDCFALCTSCAAELPKNKKACKICGTPLDTVYGPLLCTKCQTTRRAFSGACIPYIYRDGARDAILKMKFCGRSGSARTLAACILLKMREQEMPRPDVITYVPMHFIRLGMRGYNQAELLAKALGKMLSVPVEATLRKTKHTVPQSKKGQRERILALRGMYAVLPRAAVRDKKILLVDDVVTTGSTMQVCASLLKKHGAKDVQIAAVAATRYNHK